MNKLILAGVLAVASVVPATAGDVLSSCEEYLTAQGEDTTGCACLADAVAPGSSIETEILAVASGDLAIDAISDETSAVADACFPEG